MAKVSSVLSASDRETLLRRARQAVERATAGESGRGPPPPREGPLSAPMGAFVTLHTSDGELRGCIGTLSSERPLAEVIDEMAASAATRDPRFSPVSPAELDDLVLEISVLSPLEKIAGPEDVRIGVDGLLVSGFGRRGVLLPQVATEHELDPVAFLDATCKKAGLPADAWRSGLARIERFQAEVFSEPAAPHGLGSRPPE